MLNCSDIQASVTQVHRARALSRRPGPNPNLDVVVNTDSGTQYATTHANRVGTESCVLCPQISGPRFRAQSLGASFAGLVRLRLVLPLLGSALREDLLRLVRRHLLVSQELHGEV